MSYPAALTIHVGVPRAHRAEAGILLRTGALLNAVGSSARNMLRPVVTPEDQCDQLHSWITVGSHLVRGSELFTRSHDGLAWKLAKLGEPRSQPFEAAMSLDKLRATFERDSSFMVACRTLRDKVMFHGDVGPFMDWLDAQPPTEAVCLFSQGGPQIKDIVSDAGALTLVRSADQALDLAEFSDTLSAVSRALPRLLEAMIHGMVAKFDLAMEAGVRKGHHIVLFYAKPEAGRSPDE